MCLLLGLQLPALEQVSPAVETCLHGFRLVNCWIRSRFLPAEDLLSLLAILAATATSLFGLFRRDLKNPAKFNSSLASRPIKPGVSVSCTRYVWQLRSTCHDNLCPVLQVPNIIWASLLVRSQRFAPCKALLQYFSTAKICSVGWANLKVSRIFADLSINCALFSLQSCVSCPLS